MPVSVYVKVHNRIILEMLNISGSCQTLRDHLRWLNCYCSYHNGTIYGIWFIRLHQQCRCTFDSPDRETRHKLLRHYEKSYKCNSVTQSTYDGIACKVKVCACVHACVRACVRGAYLQNALYPICAILDKSCFLWYVVRRCIMFV